MAFTALQFNANALYQGVNVAAHGFTMPGYVVRFNGTNFVGANSTSETNAAMVGMISSIPNVNQFYVTQAGFVSGLTVAPEEGGAFIPGTTYYLSQTTGLLTAVKPTTVGLVELPCFVPYTSNSGFFLAHEGDLIESGPLFDWTILVDMDATMLPNNGYLMTATVPTSLMLPPTSVVGDVLKVATSAISTDSLLITQDAGQYILQSDDSSTVGIAGGLELYPSPTNRRGSLELLCVENDLGWRIMNGTGNWYVI